MGAAISDLLPVRLSALIVIHKFLNLVIWNCLVGLMNPIRILDLIG